jgi:hypothetical protein
MDGKWKCGFGTVCSAFAALAMLNIANPDALIVRVNFARLAEHRSFDPVYADSLSADATPTLIRLLPRLPQADQRVIADTVRKRWIEPHQEDWRVWSVDRAAARSAAMRSKRTILAYCTEAASP